MQTKGAIGNLINRYRAVLKKCNLLNTFGSLAIASAIALSGAGMASAVTFSGDINLSGVEGKVDTSTQAGAYQINNGEWVSDEPGVSVSQQDKDDSPVFAEGDGNYGIYLNGAAEKADIMLNGANFNVKTDNHAGYGARVGFTGGTIKVVEGTTNTIGQMLTIDGQDIVLKAVTADGKDSVVSADKGDLVVTGYLTTTEGASADLSGADIFIKSGQVGVEGKEQTGAMIHGVSSGITVGNLTFEEGTALAVFGDRTVSGDNDRALAIKNGTVTFKDGTFIGGSAENGVTKNTLTLEKAEGADFANVVVAEKADFKIGRSTTLDGVAFTNNGTVDLAADLNVNNGSVFEKGAVTVGKAGQEKTLAVGINVAQGGLFNVDSLTVAGADGKLTTLTVDNKHDTANDKTVGDGTNVYVGTLDVQNYGTVNISGVAPSGAMNVSLAAGELKIAANGQVNVSANGTLEITAEKYMLTDGFIVDSAENGKISLASGARFKANDVTYQGNAFNTQGKLDFNSLTVSHDDKTLALSGNGEMRIESGLTADKGITINDFELRLNGESGAVTGAVTLNDASAAFNVEEGNWSVADLTVTSGKVNIGKAGSDIDGVLTVNGTLDAGTTAAAVTVGADGRLTANGAIKASNGAIKVESVGVAAIDFDKLTADYKAGGISLDKGAILEVAYSGETWGKEQKETLFASGTTDGQIKFAAGSTVKVEGNTVADLNGYHVADTTLKYDASSDSSEKLNTTVKAITVSGASGAVTIKADNLGLVGSADGGELISGAGDHAVKVEVQQDGIFRLGDTTSSVQNSGMLTGSIIDDGISGGEIQSVNGTYTVTGGIEAAESTFAAYNSVFKSEGNVNVKGLSVNNSSFTADCKMEVGAEGIVLEGDNSSVTVEYNKDKISANKDAEGSISNTGIIEGSGLISADNYYTQTGAQTFDGNVVTIKAGQEKVLATSGELGDSYTANGGNSIQFNDVFTAKNGSVIILDSGYGAVKFGNTVTAGDAGDTKDSQLIISKLGAAEASNATFTAKGNNSGDNDVNGFIWVKELADTTNARTFATEDNGLISIGNMDLQELKNQVALADEYVKTVTADKDFAYKSAIAASGVGIDLSTNKFQADGGTAASLDIAKDHLFVADVSDLKKDGSNALLDGKGSEQYSFADGSGLHLAGIKATGDGEKYTIVTDTSGSTAFKQAASDDNYATGVFVSSDNRLLDVTVSGTASEITATAKFDENSAVLKPMDSSLAGLLKNYSSDVNAKNDFLAAMLNNQAVNGLTDAQVAQGIEGAAKAPMAVGAPQTAVSVATMGADYAMARTSFAPRVAGAAAVAESGEYTNISAGDNMANGMNLWIMPMYQNNKADGFKSGSYETAYDSDFFGVAVGADYTWANSFRLGATVNMGSGSSDSTGTFAKTENDYDSVGFGVYAGYMLGNLGLSADVNYTSVSNDITQASPVMALAADGDVDVWSVGARAEYKIATSAMDIIPHIGLRYSNISMDAMNFSGVLTTDADSANVWQMPIGVTFAKDFATESGWNVKPSLDLAVIPAFGDTDMAQTVQFAGVNGIASMNTEIMDDVSGRAQIGIEASKGNFYMGLDYAYQGSSNMDSHGVQANFGFKF